MKYWINVHHPPVEGESRRNQRRVYLQRKNEHLIDKFREGDYALIYETKNLSRQWVEVVSNGNRRTVKLRQGRGGIIALVEIASSFRRGKWTWNGIPFIGSFDTAEFIALGITFH